MQSKREIQAVVKKVNQYERKTDSVYWRAQPYVTRLAVLEELRQEYHRWRYGAEPGFQRVYTIVKRQ
jgi:hypothetical protein